MQDIAAHTYRAQDHGPDKSVVLTIAEPIDGVWQLSLEYSDVVVSAKRLMDDLTLAPYRLDEQVTTDNDSDADAAGEHAIDLLRDDFDIAVDTIVYPDGSTIDCEYA